MVRLCRKPLKQLLQQFLAWRNFLSQVEKMYSRNTVSSYTKVSIFTWEICYALVDKIDLFSIMAKLYPSSPTQIFFYMDEVWSENDFSISFNIFIRNINQCGFKLQRRSRFGQKIQITKRLSTVLIAVKAYFILVKTSSLPTLSKT